MRPSEPPQTSTRRPRTWSIRARAAGSRRSRRRRSGRAAPARALRRESRCRPRVTSPACALPGAIQSPGLPAWKVAVAAAVTAAPAISPVEPSTPLGTSQAKIVTSAAGRVDRLDRAARPGRAARRSKPVPRIASTIAAGAARAPPDRTDAPVRPAGARGWPARRPGSSSGAPSSEHVDVAAAVAQQARGHEPVAAVVALAADDRHAALGRGLVHEPARGPRRRAPSARSRGSRAPRSPSGRSRAAARRRAAASASRGGSRLQAVRTGTLGHRDRARVRAGVGERDTHDDPQARGALGRRRRAAARRGAPPSETTSTSRQLQAVSPSAFATASLAQKRAARCCPGRARAPRTRALGSVNSRSASRGRRASARSRRSISSRSMPIDGCSFAAAPSRSGLTRP